MCEAKASPGICGRDDDGASEEGATIEAVLEDCPLRGLEAMETNPPGATEGLPMSSEHTENPKLSIAHDR